MPRRIAARLLLLWSLFSPTGIVWAGPVADAAAVATQRPTVTATPGGIPLVNIAAPNPAGLSYNRYQRFDIDPAGLILNNSKVGGAIAANPNFAGRTATTIVNEVVGALPSQLKGELSVFGDPAKVILANPNGITCNGCCFVNTSGVALTTGAVRFLDTPGGNATTFESATALAFSVSGGQILVTGSGLASPLSRLDLIAQTLKLEAPTNIGRGALNLIAGRNTVDADSLDILARKAGNDAAAIGTSLAIDASLLGAMNAGHIRLVSTAAGMGVRAAANLAASSGDLIIHTNGDLELATASAARDIALIAQPSPDVSPMASGAAYVTRLTGNLEAGQDIFIGNLGSAVGTPSRVIAPTSGWLRAGRHLQIVSNLLDVPSAAQLQALNGNLEIALLVPGEPSGDPLLLNRGLLEASRNIVFWFDPLGTSQNPGVIAAGNDIALAGLRWFAPNPYLESRPAPIWANFNQIPRSSQAFAPDGGLLADQGPVSRIDNTGGLILAGHDLLMAHDGLSGGRLRAANDVHILAQSAPPPWITPSPETGLIEAGRDLLLEAPIAPCAWCGAPPNRSEAPLARSTANPTPTDRFVAGRNAVFLAPPGGQGSRNLFAVEASRDVRVDIPGDFENAGLLQAGRDIVVKAATFTNQPFLYTTQQTSNQALYPGCTTGTAGICTADTQHVGRIALLQAARDIVIDTPAFLNGGGILQADRQIDIATTDFTNQPLAYGINWHSSYSVSSPASPAPLIAAGPGGSGPGAVPAPGAGGPGSQPSAQQSSSGFIPLGSLPALIQASGNFTVSGWPRPDPGTPASPPATADTPAAPPPSPSLPVAASSFVNTGSIAAGTVLIRAGDLRNGLDPVADYYRRTALPTASPFQFDPAVEGGQIVAESALLLDGFRVLNTGYVASSGLLAVAAESLENVKRNASYSEDRTVPGGTLHIRGDTVQPGGAMAAAAWELDVGSVTSRSGEFLLFKESPEETQAASSAFVSALAASLGDDYHFEEAVDHLTATFTPNKRKKKKKGLSAVLGAALAFVVSFYTAGVASAALAVGESAGSAWAAGGLANMAASQGLGSLVGSAVSQLASNSHVDWGQALKSGLTAGLTAGLANAPLFAGESLNQIAGVQDIGAVGAKVADFNFDDFGMNLLGMAGRGVVTAGVSTAINGGSFETAFRHSVVSDLGAVAANVVGQTTEPLTPGNVLAHASVGCATASAQGTDCAAGALGGAGAALVNPMIDSLTSKVDSMDRTAQHGAASILASGVLAEILGLDGTTAASAALNETLNNWLSKKPETLAAKSEQQRYNDATQACYGGDETACGVARSLATTSARRDAVLNSACTLGGSAACQETIRLAQDNGNMVILGKDGTFYVYQDTTGVIKAPDWASNAFQDQTAQGVTDLAIGEGIGAGLKAVGFVTSKLLSVDGAYLGEIVIRPGIQYSPLSPGPLAKDITDTFRSGTYTSRTLKSDEVLYRVISENGNPTGSFWTSIKPSGPLQSVIDSAIDQNWGNTATRVITANIPAGTTIYEGVAAAQRGLVGGGPQVYIPKINPLWIIQ